MEAIRELAQFFTILSCGLFAGAAIYVSLVEHPARAECGPEIAATEFGPSYRRAAIMQASLAAIGFFCSMIAWFAGASLWWLVGGVLLGSVIPFTFAVIMPTNKLLLAPDLDKGSAQTRALLYRWGRLHAVRTVLSGIALVVLLLSV